MEKNGSKQMRDVWEFAKSHPKSTAGEMATGIGYPHANVSSILAQMHRRGMVTRTRRTFIRKDNAHKQSLWEYEVVGTVFQRKPFVLAPIPGTRDCVPIPGARVPKPALMVPQTQQVANTIPPQTTTLPAPLVKPLPAKTLSEAEQFAAFLEFKQLKKAGLI